MSQCLQVPGVGIFTSDGTETIHIVVRRRCTLISIILCLTALMFICIFGGTTMITFVALNEGRPIAALLLIWGVSGIPSVGLILICSVLFFSGVTDREICFDLSKHELTERSCFGTTAVPWGDITGVFPGTVKVKGKWYQHDAFMAVRGRPSLIAILGHRRVMTLTDSPPAEVSNLSNFVAQVLSQKTADTRQLRWWEIPLN